MNKTRWKEGDRSEEDEAGGKRTKKRAHKYWRGNRAMPIKAHCGRDHTIRLRDLAER